MSKHRHKSNENGDINRNQNMNRPNMNMNNNPFGISPQQLLAMLGNNFDMSGMGNLLSSMNREGFDFNSLNQQMQGFNGGFNFNNDINPMNSNSMNSPKGYTEKDVKDTQYDTSKEKRSSEKLKEEIDLRDINEEKNMNNKNDDNVEIYDENIQLLYSLRSIVDPNKYDFIDSIIEFYNKGAFEDNSK